MSPFKCGYVKRMCGLLLRSTDPNISFPGNIGKLHGRKQDKRLDFS